MTTLGFIFRPQFAPELLQPAARAAEAAGVREMWLFEDCFDEAGVSAATAALACTDRLQVGIGVLPVPLRNVALTAMELATIERLFPGRLHAGFGHGVLDWMGQIGARVESPMTLLREYLTALQALLSGDTVSSRGRYVTLDDVRLSWPPQRKPALHVGAGKPRTIALAGELGDGLVLTGGTTPAEVEKARAIYDAARGERPGRVTVYLMAVTGTHAQQRYAIEAQHWGLDPDDEVGAFGDATAIARAVARLRDAGADAVILQPTAQDDPQEYARFVGEQLQPLLG